MSFTTFRGTTNIGDFGISEMVKTNLIYFFDWGFLETGAYFNINIPQSGAYGGDESRLRPVKDPYYADGQVWEGFRSNWVWESGLSRAVQPIRVSGVFVNNTFIPVSGGDVYIDYPNGRAIFSSAKSTSSVVRAEFSTKWVNVYDGNDIPWTRTAEYDSQKIDTDQFLNFGSGDKAALSEVRLQLPAVIISIDGGRYYPYELGWGHSIHNEITFHVVAQKGSDVERISDIVANQGADTGKTIFGFNVNTIADENRFPLDYRGSIASGALTFPQLVVATEDGGYRWRKIRMFDSNKQKMESINQDFYIRPINMTTEVVMGLL